MTPQAALFDLDGLMLDTERPYLMLFQREAKKRGFDIPFETLTRCVGLDERSSRIFLTSNLGDAFPYQDVREVCVRIGRENGERDGIAHRPGLLPLLQRLQQKKIPAAVATSTLRDRAFWKLDCAKITGYFAAVITRDDIERGKPAPDIFLAAAKSLAVQPEHCVGFEDSPAGLQSLAAAGIRSVFIKDTVEPNPDILSAVWRRYETLAQAMEIFA